MLQTPCLGKDKVKKRAIEAEIGAFHNPGNISGTAVPEASFHARSPKHAALTLTRRCAAPSPACGRGMG